MPEYLDMMPCTTIVEWKTNLMCTDTPLPVDQVPCYVYDVDGYRHNLSPLINHKTAYFVESEEEAVEFYVNPCQDIAGKPLRTSSLIYPACQEWNLPITLSILI